MVFNYAEVYSREFELLVHCSRIDLDAKRMDRVEELLNERLDWTKIVRNANYHGVRPLLYRNLSVTNQEAVPDEFRDYLSTEGHATAAFNLFLAKELGRLMRLFRSSDIDAISLKGPVLAQLAYSDLSLRPFVDLDVLVRPKQQKKILAILNKEGYKPFPQISRRKPLSKALYIWQARQCPMERGGGTFNLDLHFGIMPRLYYYASDFETLFSRRQMIPIAGEEIPGLDASDLVLMLCYHGEKNRWETLKYICDLGEFLRTRPEFDWNELMSRAAETNGERILFLGLSLASTFFELDIPQEIVRRMRADRYITSLSEMFARRLPKQMDLGVAPLSDRIRLHMKLQNSFNTKARYGLFALLRRLSDFEI